MYQNIEKTTSFLNFWKINRPQFSLYAKEAKEVSLEFYKTVQDNIPYQIIRLNSQKHKLGDYWYYEDKAIQEGCLYRWNVDGVSILDPLALSYTGNMPVKEKMNVAAKKVVRFKAGKALAEKVNVVEKKAKKGSKKSK